MQFHFVNKREYHFILEINRDTVSFWKQTGIPFHLVNKQEYSYILKTNGNTVSSWKQIGIPFHFGNKQEFRFNLETNWSLSSSQCKFFQSQNDWKIVNIIRLRLVRHYEPLSKFAGAQDNLGKFMWNFCKFVWNLGKFMWNLWKFTGMYRKV